MKKKASQTPGRPAVGCGALVLPTITDPLGRDFFRRIVSRELYAKGKGTMSTMECGHINSGPTEWADDYEKPCLTCESIARQNTEPSGCRAETSTHTPTP